MAFKGGFVWRSQFASYRRKNMYIVSCRGVDHAITCPCEDDEAAKQLADVMREEGHTDIRVEQVGVSETSDSYFTGSEPANP